MKSKNILIGLLLSVLVLVIVTNGFLFAGELPPVGKENPAEVVRTALVITDEAHKYLGHSTGIVMEKAGFSVQKITPAEGATLLMPNLHKSYGVVILLLSLPLTAEHYEAITRYVKNGGVLVVVKMGTSAMDKDEDGKLGPGESNKIGGYIPEVLGTFMEYPTDYYLDEIEVVCAHPVLEGLDLGKKYPLDLGDYRSGKWNAVRATSGRSLLRGMLYKEFYDREKKSFIPTAEKGVYDLIVLNKYGKGLAITLANNLFEAASNPLIGRLLQNLFVWVRSGK